MKKVTAFLLAAVMVLALAGCGKNSYILYTKTNFDKIVELPEYENIKVDKSSEEFKVYYQGVVDSDVENNNFYAKKTDGYVAEGDSVNIDYVGKLNGQAFEGGTASDYTLVIGSNSFIDGFEKGLIGVAVGSTVDLNLRFPDEYKQSPDLAGKDVVFTVKVNYIQTSTGLDPATFYSKLGYKTFEDYEKNLTDRAVENFIVGTVAKGSKIKEYPEKELKIMLDSYKKSLEKNLKSQYGTDLKTYLESAETTEEDLDKMLTDNKIKPLMDYQIPLYAILNKEGMKVTKADIDKKINLLIEESGNPDATPETLIDAYGEYYFEYLLVNEKVVDFLLESAKITE